MAQQSLEQLAINTIRTLSMDAVQAAVSGHPGTPMALAPTAYVLWNEVLRYDPAQPAWPNRDRFVLSCGHASMLLYSVLHLAEVKQLGPDGRPTDGLAVPLDDIRRFRQLGSRCPGHPEHGHTSGVETTTGPLGQGIGNSVGMAIASRWLAAHYNRPGFELFDFNVYALCSDGDLMEGVGGEAASIAGHLKLSNLCWIYDDNHITIEGRTSLSFSEDVATRFAGYGWNVVRLGDANDLDGLRSALQAFHATTDRPTLIIVRSVIGFGSPHKADSHEAHGAALGEEEVRLTKAVYGWPENEKFLVPAEVPALFRDGLGARGQKLYADWTAKFAQYRAQYPESGRGTRPDGAPRAAPGLGRRHSALPRRRQGDRQPGLVGQGAQPGGQERPLAAGRLGRPGSLDQHALEVCGGRRFRGRPIRRTQLPLRHPRARHGNDPQRHEPVRVAALRRHVLRLFRLHAAARSGWPPSWGCRCSTSSPTIRSAWARTGLPTSPSNNWPPCGRFPTCW